MNPRIDPKNPHNLDIYTQLIHYMNEAVWIGDKEEKTVYANPKFCSLLGYDLEDILGMESYEFWDDESREIVKRANHSERKKGKASSYEGRLLTKGGKHIPVLLSGAPLPDGGTIGIMTDLSEVKKKEKSEKILSQSIEHAGDAIILLGAKGEILSWNHGAKKIFGYKKDEVEKKNITFFFPSLDKSTFQTSGGSEFVGLELIAEHKTDGERIVHVSIVAIYSSKETLEEGHLCIVRDITLEKRSEIELSSRYQKIKDAYEWLGRVQRQSDYLTDLISLTSSGYDPRKVFPTIIHGVVFLSGADACEIRLHDQKKGTLELASHFGFTGNLRNYKTVFYHDSWGEKAFLSESPYYLMDLVQDKKYPLVKHFIQEKFTSSLTVALRGKNGCVGSITLLSRDARILDLYTNTFLEKYLRLVEIIVNAL